MSSTYRPGDNVGKVKRYIRGTQMKKNYEMREKTRSELITAFWKLYEKKNIDKITIAELTSLAGYHRGTFYEYFQDIYDLLDQEENAIIAQLPQMFTTIANSKDINDPISIISKFYMVNGKHLNILITQGNTDFLDRFKDTIYPMFLQIINVEHSPELILIAEYGISAILMTLQKWYNDGCQLPLPNFIKLIYSLNFNGFFNTILSYKEDSLNDIEAKIPDKLY